MKIAVTMTHCSRPVYTSQALTHLGLALATHPITGGLFLACEPGNAKVLDACRAFVEDQVVIERAGGHVVLRTNGPDALGVNRNTFSVIDAAFAHGADFVVHVEDDILLAPDALDYFAWAAETFNGHADYLTVTGYNRESELPPEDAAGYTFARTWFHPWAWGVWEQKWRFLRGWVNLDAPMTWDVQVNKVLVEAKRKEVYPLLARSQNIGHYSSIHPGAYTPEWYAANHTLKHWAGNAPEAMLEPDWSFGGDRQGADPKARAKGAL